MTNSFLRVFTTLWIAIAPVFAMAQADTAGKKPAAKPADSLKKPVELKEVKISTRKNYIEQKIDRTVLNIDAQITNTGTNALELLEKAPGVMVDQDGKISMKGQQGVIVLIDNRPTYLTGTALAAYLKSLPSGSISQIELIPNPPARYDASGSAGMINIRTRKLTISGLNGTLNLGLGYSPNWRHNESLSLNYRKNKFNFFSNLAYNVHNSWRRLDIDRWFYNDAGQQVSAFEQTTIMHPKNSSPNIKAGMDFYASASTTVGLVFTGAYSRGDENKAVQAIASQPSGITDSVISARNKQHDWLNNNGLNLNLSHKFDSLGHELTTDLDYIVYHSSSSQQFLNQVYNVSAGRQTSDELHADLPSSIHIYTAKADYEHPLSDKAKLSVGLKGSYVNTDNTASYFQLRGNDRIPDYDKTNHFLYKEHINAVYINLNKEWKRLSVQAGLRMEQTLMNGRQLGNSIKPDSSFRQSYTNLFPTLYLSYKLDSARDKLTLYYGRRVHRPFYQDLNPFIFLLDKFSYFAGNPYLRPEFSNKVDLNFNHDNKLNIDIFYNISTSLISEVIEQEQGIFISRTGNIGKMRFFGISTNLSLKGGKWYTLNLYSEAVTNDFSGLPGNNGNHVKSFYFYINPNNQFSFGKGWGAELSGMYVTPNQSAQFKKKALYNINAGIQKQILHENGTVKFTVRDVLDHFRPQGDILNIPNTRASYYNAFDNRVATFSFTYNFSKGMATTKKRDTGGAGSEQERVKN
ncbi:outer membrane beta-barrel family protein [Pedobacter sp. JY14-1]|uniref:outer membrane beta-barrel family protein n=1 Tax=Pedobacter sp. JY14-1 TaxID=3034151 RepID=UPI0023E24260|nr:outer membrane beta-barrel family protein [Pedobacter sp. JY14-1]